MIEIIAVIIFVVFTIHMTVLITRLLLKKHFYNHTIYLAGGKYAGDYQGTGYRLIDDVDEAGRTIVREKTVVTSSFSAVYVRLYQLYTGRCYDAYLESVLQIGRIEGSPETPALILDDSVVSKKHCMLYRRGNQLLIQDLESTNHTYLNGCQIQGVVPITHGDHLSLGGSEYQFQCYYQR